MDSVKQKIKDITVNRLFQSKNDINEIYSALEILLDKNYKKYDFDKSIKVKNKKIMEYITHLMMSQDILYVIHFL